MKKDATRIENEKYQKMQPCRLILALNKLENDNKETSFVNQTLKKSSLIVIFIVSVMCSDIFELDFGL